MNRVLYQLSYAAILDAARATGGLEQAWSIIADAHGFVKYYFLLLAGFLSWDGRLDSKARGVYDGSRSVMP